MAARDKVVLTRLPSAPIVSMRGWVLFPIHIVFFRIVGIVAHVLPIIDFDDVRTRVLAALHLGHSVFAGNVFSVSYVVVLVPTAGTIILTFDLRHVTSRVCCLVLESRKYFNHR